MQNDGRENLPAEAEEIFQPVLERLPSPVKGKQVNMRNLHLVPERTITTRQNKFIQAIRAGASVTRACSIARISPAVLSKWMEDPSFKTRYSWAKDAVTDYLEELALKKAEEDTKVLLELLRARRPGTYAPKANKDDGAINVVINANFGQPQQPAKEIEVQVVDGKDD